MDDIVVRRAPSRNASVHRAPHGREIPCHGLGPVAFLLQQSLQIRHGGLRRLLLLHGFIDCLLRLRGLSLDLASRSGKFTRECRGTRLCLVERAALLLGIRRHRLARRARPPG